MDPDEVAGTFRVLREQGKVLHFGVSNHMPWQFAMLHRRIALTTHQIEFSPLQMAALNDGALDPATDLGLPPMIWSPLAGGRVFSGQDEQPRRVRAVLEDLGRAHGVAAATMAYAWIRRHPSKAIPITGSGCIEVLREAVAALDVKLGAEDWYRVWQASMGREVA